MRALSASEVKTHLPSLLDGVEEREERIVVTRRGRPVAVLLNHDEYERLRATLDVLSDPQLMRQIRKSRRFWRTKSRGVPFEEVLGEDSGKRARRSRR